MSSCIAVYPHKEIKLIRASLNDSVKIPSFKIRIKMKKGGP